MKVFPSIENIQRLCTRLSEKIHNLILLDQKPTDKEIEALSQLSMLIDAHLEWQRVETIDRDGVSTVIYQRPVEDVEDVEHINDE